MCVCHVTSQENLWVTDHDKVVFVKWHNEQKFSIIINFIVYDEKHGQNCWRFGTRRLDGKSCLIPHIHHVHSRKVCREDQVLKAEGET